MQEAVKNILNLQINSVLKIVILAFFLIAISNNKLLAQDHTISYFHDLSDKHDPTSIQSESFTPYTTPIKQGTNNGVFWFEVKVNNQEDEDLFRIIQLSILSLDVKAFLGNKSLPVSKNSPFPNIKTVISPGESIYYVKVNCHKQANVSIQLLTDHQFSKKENHKVFRIGLYFGIVLIIILINLFYFFTFQDKTFLYYTFMLFSINACLWFGDTGSYLFSQNDRTIDIFEFIVHLFAPIFTAIFVFEFVNIRQYLPRYKWFLVPSVGLAWLFGFMYIAKGNFLHFAISDTFAMIAMSTCWFATVLLFNKKIYNKFLCISYILLWIFSFDYFSASKFGLSFLEIDAAQLKIAGVFEMILMTFSVVYRMQVLNKENGELRLKIEAFMAEIEADGKDETENLNETLLAFGLTTREIEVAVLLYSGISNELIAKQLFISKNTVKYHIKNIYAKLDVKNRKEAKILFSKTS